MCDRKVTDKKWSCKTKCDEIRQAKKLTVAVSSFPLSIRQKVTLFILYNLLVRNQIALCMPLDLL